METENDIMIAFLDTSVSREPHGRLTTSVYRKPTHTGQCLAYDLHRPQSVKRGTFKCLYNRAKRLVTKQSVISEEKKSVISSCFKRFCLLLRPEAHQDMKNSPPRRNPETEFKSTAAGFAVCQRSVDTTLRSHLVRPKDTIDPAKQDGVSTKIPVNAEKSTLAKPRKIYTGEDQRA